MKKLFALILVVLMVLTGCSEVPEGLEQPETPSVPEQEEPEEIVLEGTDYLRENFPIIDGSTSLIPLEAGIRAAIFGKTIEEAALDVSHTTTWGSLQNLLEGNVDMIFSVALSDSQKRQAEYWEAELESVPVAYEGFVFVVNAKNPVDELTQEQLRKIYSGEITNWKEVGGNDAEIIAYQRNTDSGSQNYMIEFMGEVPLMDAPSVKRPGSMAGLMDAIAINDNAENAIGYSVYTYAADMYGNGDEIKFIKVDGAKVNKNSMAKGEYPLVGYNYAIFNAEEPEDSNVRKLVEWMLSDEGQLAAAKAGYVTMRDIGFDYSEEVIEKYEATGTGIKNPGTELPSYEYIVNRQAEIYSIREGLYLDYSSGKYSVNCLKNKELEEEIHAFIEEKSEELRKYRPEFEAYIERRKGNSEYGPLGIPTYWGESEEQQNDPVRVSLKAKNGYIYAVVTLEYWYNVQEGYNNFYKTETAVWDMESGKRLDVTDLFYEGIDIDEVLYKYLMVKSDEKIDAFYSYERKADFAGLPKEGWSITPEGIYFDYGNPYFTEGVFVDFKTLPEGILVTERPRDMKGSFIGATIFSPKLFRIKNDCVYKYIDGESSISYALLPEDSYPNAKKMNSIVEEHIEKYFNDKAIIDYFVSKGFSKENAEGSLWWADWRVTDYGGRYAIFSGGSIECYEVDENNVERIETYPIKTLFVFDIKTGKEIEYEDMLLPGWKEHCTVTDGVNVIVNYKDILEKDITGIDSYGSILFRIGWDYLVKVDEDYIRW